MRIKSPSPKSTNKKPLWAVLFALWLVFILLSQVPLLANTLIDYSDMDETVESHLRFPVDGRTGHYYVERHDTAKVGLIDVEYTTDSNSLEVDCTNIKVLKIYCRDMYDDKSEDVFKRDPELDSNYYKTYFYERDHFHVHVYSQQMIEKLEWIDTPVPYNVTVNGREWWLTNINYTHNNDGIVLTKVPAGHNYVDLYFKTNDQNAPVAKFTTDKTIQCLGEPIKFDASSSYDTDGEIIRYVWDLGEGTYKIGETTEHTFSEEGTYNVILTVKDDDYLIDRAIKEITVISSVMSLVKSVDKPIATPGSVLTYTITPTINATWEECVKDIVVTDILSDDLEFVDSTPKPMLDNKTLTWKFNKAICNKDLPTILLQTLIDKKSDNSTFITNSANLEYKSLNDGLFPQELSNTVRTKVNTGSILAPRILSPVPDIEMEEDSTPFELFLSMYEYDLQDSGSELKWYITEEDEFLYGLTGENSDDDIITITPRPNAYGDSKVTLWLVDSDGYTVNQPLWINITPVNDKPLFSKIPDLTVHHSQPYIFNYEPYISDIDTPKEQLRLFVSEKSQSDSGTVSTRADTQSSNIQINGFNVTYTFPKSYLDKEVFVALIVFDGYGNDGENIKINVTDDSIPILLKKIPDIWLEEGETRLNAFDLYDYFEDPNDDSLFYSFGELYITVIINANHVVDITAPSDWDGVESVTFRAKDPMGAIVEDTILVTVIPINDPPVITGMPETFIVHFDSDYHFDMTPYIFDEDNELSELVLILSDEDIRLDPLNHLKIIMNYPEEFVNMDIGVMLIVSDGQDTGSQKITVKVTDDWPPEIIETLPDITFYEDESLINAFDLSEYFSDKDSHTLFYTYGQKHVNVMINLDLTVDFSAAPDWNGMESVTIRATDPVFAFVESVITVTVLPVNDAPIIQPIPTQYGMVKESLKLDLTEFINDIDNNTNELTISYQSNKFDIFINGRELDIYSVKPGREYITIIVSDGLAETSETVLIEIQDEKTTPPEKFDHLMSILWLIILIIIIIILITGFALYRNHVGNYSVEEVLWINNVGIILLHETSSSTNIFDPDPTSGLISKNKIGRKVTYKIKKKSKKRKVHGKETFDTDPDMLAHVLNIIEGDKNGDEIKTKSNNVKEIKIKGKNLLVTRGDYTVLATAFTGRSGKRLYKKNNSVLNKLEGKYGEKLTIWKSGNRKFPVGKYIIQSSLIPPS